MSRRFVAAARKILSKLDPRPKHGPIPQYSTRKTERRQELDEWWWLVGPERKQRIYDSSLSMPGRICDTDFCHHFVAGSPDRPCPNCGGTP